MSHAVEIRPAEGRDRDAAYGISLQTGDAGGDATLLFRDPELMGHIYVGPYLAMPLTIGFVAEDTDGLIGYVVGVSDTMAFERETERRWWPPLRRRYPEPDVDRDDWTPDQRRIWSIHHPEKTPADIVRSYPAHVHMNLLPRAQRKGIGSRLLDAWIEAALRQGVGAVHARVSAANTGGLAFWRSRGFEPVREDPEIGSKGTVWCGRRL
jgi:GNAT superfamily N-acetyltransferase